MWDAITELFFPHTYIPHGHCYLWQTSLVWLHVTSDCLITLAYYSIPLILVYFVSKREDMPFKGIVILFSAFILSCGTTHILEIWTLWNPAYWLSGAVKAFTALVSVYTAASLVSLIPKALSLPSPSQLETLNHQLHNQISERQAAEQVVRQLNEELEQRVQQRTAELEAANEKLQLEIAERHQVELALRESQHFTQRLADVTPNFLSVYDILEKKNIYCNGFITEILGYTSEEIKQQEMDVFSTLVHPEDQEQISQHRQRCLTLRDDDYVEMDCRLRDLQNNWHWIHIRETIFERSPEGKPKQILSIASDITLSKQAKVDLQRVNNQLEERVQELENRTQEMIFLGEMTDLLQACLSVSQAEKILTDLLKPLFPKYSGAVFTLNNSRDFLELVAAWGDSLQTTNLLMSHECWALSRGTSHSSSPHSPNLYCQHIHPHEKLGTTLCVPMMAQGETLGLLYLHLPDADRLTPATQRLAEAVSKQISISLANLKLRETLQEQSFRDPLTGLFNRRYLEVSMTRELHRSTRDQQTLGVIMIDIDYFKQFNDRFSHEAGDLVLQGVAAFLQDNVRQSDLVCRLGGEEFIVILPNASIEQTQERAEQLRHGIKHLNLKYKFQHLDTITASFGVSGYPDHGTTPEQLFHLADEALFQAKHQGRDRVIIAEVNTDAELG